MISAKQPASYYRLPDGTPITTAAAIARDARTKALKERLIATRTLRQSGKSFYIPGPSMAPVDELPIVEEYTPLPPVGAPGISPAVLGAGAGVVAWFLTKNTMWSAVAAGIGYLIGKQQS